MSPAAPVRQGPVKLGLLASAPLHVQVPLWRRLAAHPDIDFTAIFASRGGVQPTDFGYGKPITWDVDLLSGYRHVFLRRADRTPIHGHPLVMRDVDVIGLVRRERFDALWIHGYTFATHVMGALAQMSTGGDVLFRENQTLLHPRPAWKETAKRMLLRPLFARSGALYVGTENRRWFAHHGIPPERMFHVPYAIDNDAVRAQAAELLPRRLELRRELGIPDDGGPVIAMVARLIRKKQPLLMLEAFRRVRERHRCTMLFAGSGELEDDLRAAIARDRVPDVHITGFLNRSQVWRAYAAADMLALPTFIHETWGLVVNEAQNFGLPVVVSRKVGCAADLVTDGVEGFVVDENGPDELAERLEQLVVDPDLRARMGAAGHRRVEEISLERAVEGILQAVGSARSPG